MSSVILRTRRRHEPQRTTLSNNNKFARALWQLVWTVFYRPTPMPMYAWRRMLLRMFGARIGKGAHPCPRAKIWAPWNLSMAQHSCLANDVDCYCVARVSLGAHATVSQYSYLCTAGHDFEDRDMPLVTAPIAIEADSWVSADVFVGPGVTIGKGAVVGARSTVMSDVEPWAVVAGSPPKRLRTRTAFVRRAADE
jgi:putative colanic acid biosynthesis acetyltransferase WcaF